MLNRRLHTMIYLFFCSATVVSSISTSTDFGETVNTESSRLKNVNYSYLGLLVIPFFVLIGIYLNYFGYCDFMFIFCGCKKKRNRAKIYLFDQTEIDNGNNGYFSI